VSGPRLALRDATLGHRAVDLLFYDDVLAIVPRGGGGTDSLDPRAWLLVGALALLLGKRLRRRRERREASPETLPRRTRLVPLAGVQSVRVERRPYTGAWLEIDELRFDVPAARSYRKPWTDLLGPFFGDRLTVV
jgi:hypothetical protein